MFSILLFLITTRGTHQPCMYTVELTQNAMLNIHNCVKISCACLRLQFPFTKDIRTSRRDAGSHRPALCSQPRMAAEPFSWQLSFKISLDVASDGGQVHVRLKDRCRGSKFPERHSGSQSVPTSSYYDDRIAATCLAAPVFRVMVPLFNAQMPCPVPFWVTGLAFEVNVKPVQTKLGEYRVAELSHRLKQSLKPF